MRSLLLILSIIFLTQPYNFSESATPECTLTGNSVDNLASVLATCKEISISNLHVPAGERLTLNAQNGSVITFEGHITFGYKEMSGFLIVIHGNNITVVGAPGNLIDGGGARWWDGLGGNSGKTKPKFFQFRLTNSIVKGLNVKNSPKHCFTITNSENVILTDITYDNLDGDTQGGHNTDAFDTSHSKDVTITNCVVFNQDDCLAINSGDGHVFTNNYCYGGHGISIGSVGGRDNNVVKNIFIKNNTVVNSENGIRIKTNYNTTGIVTNVTYEDITIENITDYGFTNNYCYGG
ncbi:endopolygalacturonase I-like, partial [Agrilus planipennis]|uniref:endo-polygalacturonase n=1 Tax=Agrilus planipennis TaxID=224129 RepID=A0A1W4WWG6_AGRPL